MVEARSLRATAALGDGVQSVLGRFEYSVDDDAWTWSETTYEIFGFQPGEVVPTTALVRTHVMSGDERTLDAAALEVLRSGDPFSYCLDLRDAAGVRRTVVVVGRSDRDADGRPVRVRGCLVDITEARRVFTRDDVTDAVESVVASRWSIEQAKGVLMATCGVDADTAFSLLVQTSQGANVKVRELAAALVASMPVRGDDPVARQRARERLEAVADRRGTG